MPCRDQTCKEVNGRGRKSPPAAKLTAHLPMSNWINLIDSCSARSTKQVDGRFRKGPTKSFNRQTLAREPTCIRLIDTWSRKSPSKILRHRLGRKAIYINLINTWSRKRPPVTTLTACWPVPNRINLIGSSSAGLMNQVDGWGRKSQTQFFNERLSASAPASGWLIYKFGKAHRKSFNVSLTARPLASTWPIHEAEKPTCGYIVAVFAEPNWINPIGTCYINKSIGWMRTQSSQQLTEPKRLN